MTDGHVINRRDRGEEPGILCCKLFAWLLKWYNVIWQRIWVSCKCVMEIQGRPLKVFLKCNWYSRIGESYETLKKENHMKCSREKGVKGKKRNSKQQPKRIMYLSCVFIMLSHSPTSDFYLRHCYMTLRRVPESLQHHIVFPLDYR